MQNQAYLLMSHRAHLHDQFQRPISNKAKAIFKIIFCLVLRCTSLRQNNTY
jgi:hypothetical protein